MVFFAAGMVLLSSFGARISDRIGHLRVITLLSAVGAVMVLGFIFLDTFPAICAAVFVAGAALASISPVSLALLGVIVATRDLPRATAMFNVFYASGMLLGPLVSGRLYVGAGPVVMFYSLTGLWLALVAFTLAFRGDDPAVARRGTEALAPGAAGS
jgi:MFS family permease